MASYAFFDTAYYIEQNPDVAASWPGSVQDHYTLYGAAEGRAPTAWFDAQYYRATYPDLASLSGSQLFAHYCSYGFKEGRVTSAEFAGFNAARYLADYPDLAAGGITVNTALNHYLVYGEDEGRSAYTTSGNQIGGAVSLAVDSPAVTEGDSGLSPMVFTLTLSAPQNSDFTVSYETLNTGTATAGQDFVPTTGTVTFLAGQKTATISVAIIGDTVYEPNETVKVKFTADAFSAPVTATGTIVNDDLNPDLQPQTLVLTTGQDILAGREGNDTFLATGATLQLGDMLDGKGGNDELNVSISGNGVSLAGFAATSIETIKVKSLATGDSTLDLSDTSGVTKLESYETSGASLTFRDIQNVNAVDVSIIDTDETHTFQYDLNAYSAGVDKVDLSLSEIRGAEINFQNNNGSRSGVEQIDIVSNDRPDAGPTPAVDNLVSELNVGAALATVNITGDGDLEVEEALDENISVVNAGTLAANLTLDLSESNDGNAGVADGVAEIVYTGALGNDHVTFGSTNNAKRVVLQSGNDWVNTGTGAASVDGGTGNDTIITGALNDLVIGGEGNDSVTDAGADNALVNSNAPYVSGGNSFNLGNGNDSLTVTGSGNNTADLGAGNDSMLVGGAGEDIVNGNQSVVAGAGNDVVELNANGWADVDLGAGDDALTIRRNATANSTVSGGDGNDSVDITSNGNVAATLGAGNDDLMIVGDGNHVIDAGTGNDDVSIHGDGTHNVALGDGNDDLLIDGARVVTGNTDDGASVAATTITGGEGDDSVEVTLNHVLNTDLGAGNDDMTIRAMDLSGYDTIKGAEGDDTLWLRNESERTVDGRILASETTKTTGFETYELLDTNITLKLTDQIIETATDQDFTVSTRNSNSNDIPGLNLVAGGAAVNPFFQGMTNTEMDGVAAQWRAGAFTQSPGKSYYDDLAGGEAARLAAARADMLDWLSDRIGVDQSDSNGDGDNTDAGDQFFFYDNVDGAQTVDITGITTPDYTFTLLGGNVKDVVIADDDSVNGYMTLDFNAASGTALSYEDTLRVVDGAEITAADLYNVYGLERIELTSASATPQEWTIKLNDRVISQTTGSADLVIDVGQVPAGSKLYVELDPDVVGAANDVVIRKNANVQVYIIDVNGNQHLISTGLLGDDWNPGPYSITVENQLVFTSGPDNLVGGEDNDIFTANALAHIQAGDSADGMGGFDTLEVNVQGPANPANTLQEIFGNATLNSIERIEFNTENNVEFGGIGAGYATSLQQLATGEGNDTLTLMRQGLQYELNAGDDSISLLSLGAGATTSVYGGAGEDTVWGSTGGDVLRIRDVEYVDGGSGNDSATMETPNTTTFWDVQTVIGSYGDDGIYADVPGGPISVNGMEGNDYIDVGNNTPTDATVLGGTGNDTIYVEATNSALIYGDDNDGWTPDDGNDYIVAGNNWWWSSDLQTVTVYAEGGDDTVYTYSEVSASVSGGDGNDYLYVTDNDWWWGNALDMATVDGGNGNDTIVVGAGWWGNGVTDATVTGGNGDDNITVYGDNYWWNWGSQINVDGGANDDVIAVYNGDDVTVTGGSGDDVLTASGFDNTASVDGGSGDDVINVSGDSWWWTAATVLGGTGNDEINVSTYYSETSSITGGAGDDEINLSLSANGGEDTLIFGTITYDALQNVSSNTQGVDTITNVNFELNGAGAQDYLDFTAFLGGGGAVWTADWTGGMPNVGMGAADAAVILANEGFELTSAKAVNLGIDNNGKGVVIVAMDTDSDLASDTFDVYFVQDVDQDVGQAWAVDLVGTITSATQVGSINSVVDNLIV